MKLGFSGEAFGNLLVVMAVLAVIFSFTISNIAKKRGIDIKSTKFQIKFAVSILIIFIVLPLLFSDLSATDKLIASILASVAGFGNFFALDRLEKYFKNKRK